MRVSDPIMPYNPLRLEYKMNYHLLKSWMDYAGGGEFPTGAVDNEAVARVLKSDDGRDVIVDWAAAYRIQLAQLMLFNPDDQYNVAEIAVLRQQSIDRIKEMGRLISDGYQRIQRSRSMSDREVEIPLHERMMG